MLGKKAGHHHGKRAAGYKDNDFALTDAGAGGGRALGIGCRGEKVELVLLEERGKIGAVQQDGDLYPGQPLFEGLHHIRRGQGGIITNGVLGFGTGVGGADLRRKAAGAELAAQLGNVIAQVLGKGILRAAHVAFPAGVGHAAARHILGGKRQRLAAALHQQHGHAAGEGFHQLGTGDDGGLLCG